MSDKLSKRSGNVRFICSEQLTRNPQREQRGFQDTNIQCPLPCSVRTHSDAFGIVKPSAGHSLARLVEVVPPLMFGRRPTFAECRWIVAVRAEKNRMDVCADPCIHRTTSMRLSVPAATGLVQSIRCNGDMWERIGKILTTSNDPTRLP